MKSRWKIFLISLLIVYSVAFAATLFIDTGSWYESVKPSITPPNFVFPIVWNTLFLLLALSFSISWMNSKKKQKSKLAFAFAINLFLNLSWSILFFGIKNPIASFFELILLWFSIIFLILTMYKIDQFSSYIQIPYLIWVIFAGILNWLIAF
jgi:translocator protein